MSEHPVVGFQSESGRIVWKLHLSSSPERAYDYIATPKLREKYWAERSWDQDGRVYFEILNYPVFSGKIVESRAPEFYEFEYYGCLVKFTFKSDGRGGTDVLMESTHVPEDIRHEMIAGWVSLLLTYKAACDFNIDLRNHDPARSWVTGYADN